MRTLGHDFDPDLICRACGVSLYRASGELIVCAAMQAKPPAEAKPVEPATEGERLMDFFKGKS